MKDKMIFKHVLDELKYDKNKTIFCLGVDESYTNSGIALSVGNPFYNGYETIDCINLNGKTCKDHNDYRVEMLSTVCQMIAKYEEIFNESVYKCCIVERVRQFSRGFVNIDYIKSMGALIAYIIEASNQYKMNVYSVDTRCWKNTVVGNCQPMMNSYHVVPEKYPTVEYVIKHDMKHFIFDEVETKAGEKELRKKNPKNIFKSASGKYIHVDDDKADSICISRFLFEALLKERNVDELLKLES